MGFLDTLRHWNRPDSQAPETGVADSVRSEFLKENSATTVISDYDREQWRKKLKRLLAELPASESEWEDLDQEAGSLGFGKDWIKTTSRQEFSLLIRKIVSDREVTDKEHHSLELARALLGIPDQEAEVLFHTIVAEAEAFFGKKVRGGD